GAESVALQLERIFSLLGPRETCIRAYKSAQARTPSQRPKSTPSCWGAGWHRPFIHGLTMTSVGARPRSTRPAASLRHSFHSLALPVHRAAPPPYPAINPHTLLAV